MTHLPSAETLILPPQLRRFPDAADAWRAGIQNPEARISMSNDSLGQTWHEVYSQSDDSEILPAPGVLGVMGIPEDQTPTAIMSVDIDDVLKDTARTFMELGDFTLENMKGRYDYSNPFGISQDDVRIILQGLGDQIGPVHRHNEILDTLKQMKTAGAYIIANTSTLPGCEAAAIRALNRDYPDVFDGILFPRGGVPGQQAAITKGEVLLQVAEVLQQSEKNLPTAIAHIDDSLHHIRDFRKAMAGTGYQVVDATPAYPWNQDGGLGINRTTSPFGAFLFVKQCWVNEGII